MTSDTKWYEGHQEQGAIAMVSPQEAAHLAELHDLAIEEDKTRSRLANSAFAAAQSHVCSQVSAVYLANQSGVSAVSGASGNSRPADVFETLERDLAALASACSGLGASDAVRTEAFDPDARDSLPLMVLSERPMADAIPTESASFSVSNPSHEEPLTMNAQAQPAHAESGNVRVPVEPALMTHQPSALETDGVLHDVQSTLDSLAGMAHGLSQQKLEVAKMRDVLEERRLAALERERQLVEREERLGQMEQRLQEEKQGIERVAEHNAAVLAERSSALQTLAETVDSRDRATSKRAEVLNQEQQSIERQVTQLRARVQDLDDREASLQRQGAELADRFKQLLDAKERFGAIVKGFNETVRFNTTYSAISKTVGTGADEA
ncbi:hypothetical protein N5J43_28115 [Pseudomonas nicosulfuronedens]|uniref:Uncharacterized protein n=1 Tax=Pseudomonas nicosulfuronedens TaxID=2571105 RepID=A0A5R9QRL6_9PSED|nr:hypothetical protein [Pseudomonas nicosulfuronedens]MDH1010902.1 hypothetical protein [Pseudomonas nicosulfuronedens]MDH1982837.1 hypothetical protein [Pseudomonas nicosulfuronedens]MDH2026101.1 hypothetical protein [Pseudomonas nicosulfuronedens]TLX72215.1 hypothetical protein FAS41_23250 [Pseudomonas nicosulfuronedens]